jgi:hypothetical protein
MHSLLRFTVACLCVRRGLARVADLEKRANITLAEPISGTASQKWYVYGPFYSDFLTERRDGAAGTWSSFEIRAGTSTNNAYRVMPATSWQETWVIFGNEQERYCNVSLGVDADCAEKRGGVFLNASSSTWNGSVSPTLSTDQLVLGLDTSLGENGEGIYGVYELNV